ncbi:MAG: thioesterase [Alteromonadaceae bacterium]|nr:thioesterase [Alteromonadaceae bacterium]
MTKNSWILRPSGKPAQHADLRLICFPYAGGNASTYMSWFKWLPENIEILAIQPPGRSTRIFERAHSNMEQLVNDLLMNISESLDRPYILFGHSLGSRVAFELMTQCKKRGLRMPLQFIASGSRGPHILPRKTSIYQLPDKEFIEGLKDINGTPKAVLENSELMELCLPLLRADFELADTYACRENNIFDCPISVFSGKADTEITHEDLISWGNYFSGSVDLQMFPGDHFFIESNKNLVVNKVNIIIQNLLSEINRSKKNE